MGHRGLGGKKSPSTIFRWPIGAASLIVIGANGLLGHLPPSGGITPIATRISVADSITSGGVESRTRPTMDAVVTAAAARSLMTERGDGGRRMVITFSAQQQVHQCRYFARKRRDKLIEFRRRTRRREMAGAITVHKLIINNVKATGGALVKSRMPRLPDF